MIKKIIFFLPLTILIGIGIYQLNIYTEHQILDNKIRKYILLEKIKEDKEKFDEQFQDENWEWTLARIDTIVASKKDVHYYKNYILVFDYDTCFVEIPMTYPAGPPHYKSFVSIYKRLNKDSIFIYKFKCEYTDGKCYEDEPKSLIKEAQLKKENEKII